MNWHRAKGFCLTVCVAGWALAAQAQQPAAQAPATVSKSCSIVTGMGQSKADRALADGQYADAEQLYSAMPPSSMATVGVLRAMMGEHKLKEALALALKQTAAHPDDALLEDGLGEVRFRRGEVEEAAAAFTQSSRLDLCLARTHYDIGRYQNLRGRFKSAQLELDQAHRLAPGDPLITRAWEQTHRVRPTVEQQVAHMRELQAKADDAEKPVFEARIKRVQAEGRGDCELVSRSETAKFDMKPMGNLNTDSGNQGVGLDVSLNGSRRRLELDTGASGLVLFQQAAKALGLETEAQGHSGGVGDAGLRLTSETHVDSIKIGPMEFHNCMVRVIEARNVMPGQDGLIGADVFRNFRVTLDFPGMEVRLAPLPRRPDEAEITASLGTESEDREGLAIADTRHDPFVAPEMKNWTPIFRSGHDLIIPTTIGKVPKKLFLMDSGAGLNSISPEAAREVTGVGSDDSITVHGISGKVENVQSTGPITVQFANMRMQTLGMTAFSTDSLSRSVGVEIAGIIGFPVLRLLVFEIDYRDNLIHVTYEPHVTLGR